MISVKRFDPAPFWPLFIIVCVVLLASVAMQIGQGPEWFVPWMHDFMGLFLVVFAMFKLFDVEGFVQGFSMYDIVARRVKLYGYAYPLIELCLGIAYLGRLGLTAAYVATLVVMSVGSIGVLLAVAKGLDVRCACLGTFLKVPLSTVALVEDLGMALMSFLMLANFSGFLS